MLSILGIAGGFLCAYRNSHEIVLFCFSLLVILFSVFATLMSIISFFTTIELTKSGIKIRNVLSRSFDWSEINSWTQKQNGSIVELQIDSGKKIALLNMATNRFSNDLIAATLNKYVGAPSKSTNAG